MTRGAGVLLVACLLLLPVPAAAQTADLDAVVNGLESTYGKMNDLKADFTQVAKNRSLGQDVKADGTVYLKKGGKMRWEYKSPSPQQIVSDGTYLWVYTPELNQVNKGDAPKALAGPAGSFLQGLGRVREEFTVRFLNPANKTDGAGRPVLDLTPKKPTPLLTRLVLTLDPKDHVVREAVLYDQLQNTVTMSFNRVVINSGLGDTLFAFTPPKGAAVVPLDIRSRRGRSPWPPRTVSTSRASSTCRRSPTPSTRPSGRSRPATTSRDPRTTSPRRRWISSSPPPTT
jgi:outer membrane lipoprotein carrier protein